MKLNEFIDTLKRLVTDERTLYVLGGFGQKLTPENKAYFIEHYGFNRSVDAYGRDRKKLIMNAPENTLAYDCVCLVKSVLNGSKGYTTKPCPDISINALLRECSNVREVNNAVEPNIGDFLTFADYSHCGIYIGNNKVIECTYKNNDGVQIINYTGRGWKFAGALPYIESDKPDKTVVAGVQVMANKTKATALKYRKDGQSIVKQGAWYKNAYLFETMSDAKNALADIQKEYKDAFVTEYNIKDVIDI